MPDTSVIISVILPVYNGEKFLKEAVASILDQTENRFEFLIIDDGSTDTSETIVRSFNDSRIVYVKRNHEGLIASLNFAITQVKGLYVARMDADDIAHPDRFKKQLEFFETHPKVGICGSWAKTIAEDGTAIGVFDYPPIDDKGVSNYALLRNPFIHPSVMLRREALQKVGGYNPKFMYLEDYELWTRILSAYEGANIPEYLLLYRIHQKQTTSMNKWSMRGIRGIAVRFLALIRILG